MKSTWLYVERLHIGLWRPGLTFCPTSLLSLLIFSRLPLHSRQVWQAHTHTVTPITKSLWWKYIFKIKFDLHFLSTRQLSIEFLCKIQQLWVSYLQNLLLIVIFRDFICTGHHQTQRLVQRIGFELHVGLFVRIQGLLSTKGSPSHLLKVHLTENQVHSDDQVAHNYLWRKKVKT